MTKRYDELALNSADSSLVGTIGNVIESLRRAASQIERELNDYAKNPRINPLSPDKEHEVTRLVQNVLHEVLWMVPNLHLDGLPYQAERVSRHYRALYGEEN